MLCLWKKTKENTRQGAFPIRTQVLRLRRGKAPWAACLGPCSALFSDTVTPLAKD